MRVKSTPPSQREPYIIKNANGTPAITSEPNPPELNRVEYVRLNRFKRLNGTQLEEVSRLTKGPTVLECAQTFPNDFTCLAISVKLHSLGSEAVEPSIGAARPRRKTVQFPQFFPALAGTESPDRLTRRQGTPPHDAITIAAEPGLLDEGKARRPLRRR
jgi:hypothetical protein